MTAIPARIGRYEIRAAIGYGDGTVVLRGRDPMFNRAVAVKTLRPGISVAAGAEDWADAFQRQVEAAGTLEHPDIARLYDAGIEAGVPYLVSELVEGEPLGIVMGEESFSMDARLELAARVTGALAYAHARGVTHGAVRPGNVLRTRLGQVKVVDFGLSRLALPSSTILDHPPRLRPHHRSPEQLLGKRPDARSDVFSLGALLYEMLLGVKPFDDASDIGIAQRILSEEAPHLQPGSAALPDGLRLLLRRTLEKRAVDRHQDASELREALHSAMAQGAPGAIVRAAASSPRRPARESVALLLDVSRALPSSLSVDEALNLIMDAAMELSDAERGLLMLREPSGDLRTRLARHMLEEPGPDALRASRTVVDRCMERLEPIAITDVQDRKDLSDAKSIKEMKLKSILCVPLLLRGEPMGLIYLDSRRVRRPVRPEQVEVLSAFAAHAAVTLENARLHELATLDALTRLYLRRTFDQRLAEEVQRASRHGRPLSLLFIDLDHFKEVNDRRGHLVGDQVLKRVGATLLAMARISDVPARYGGEEFVLLAPETPLLGASVLAERIREKIRELAHPDGEGGFTVTVSIGVGALDPARMSGPEDLVRLADQALYRAKAEGRDRVCVA